MTIAHHADSSTLVDKEVLTWETFGTACRELATMVADSSFRPEILVAVARGGLLPGGGLSYALGIKLTDGSLVADPSPAAAESAAVGAASDAGTADPARVTRAVVDDATLTQMSRDFTVQSITGLRTIVLLGLLVALSVLVQFSSDATTRWLLPALTILFIVAVVAAGYLGTRRMLRRSPGGTLTLTFGDEGFTTSSEAGTSRTRYRDIVEVTVRGETVMIRGTGGAVALYPRALFPEPLLAELRAGPKPR
jgi:hypothetical protein